MSCTSTDLHDVSFVAPLVHISALPRPKSWIAAFVYEVNDRAQRAHRLPVSRQESPFKARVIIRVMTST
jgi:hypothetical protein